MAKTSTIECAFCQGKGTDPFGLLSELATCQVCLGAGKVDIVVPFNSCVACGGSGVKPHSRLVCTVCNGKGSISHQKGSEACPKCQGTGNNRESDLPCSTCSGSGKVEWKKDKEVIKHESY